MSPVAYIEEEESPDDEFFLHLASCSRLGWLYAGFRYRLGAIYTFRCELAYLDYVFGFISIWECNVID